MAKKTIKQLNAARVVIDKYLTRDEKGQFDKNKSKINDQEYLQEMAQDVLFAAKQEQTTLCTLLISYLTTKGKVYQKNTLTFRLILFTVIIIYLYAALSAILGKEKNR